MRVLTKGFARYAALLAVLFVPGCVTPTPAPQRPAPQAQAAQPSGIAAKLSAQRAARQFVSVVRTVEPVAERECRARTKGANCDFQIVVDDRAGQPANAYQTVDRSGRPVIAFTLALIREVRNADELAFVMGHETAHHISGHIRRQQENASAGAVIFAGLAVLTGGDASAIQSAQEIGAAVGARSYSKEFELEADALGTVITKHAGYDPVKGAQFFTRIPDPGNRFLGTHPPNAQRIETVRRVAAGL
ncbi:M48 family metallopeptidase [Aquicoccus sp. G2-2]|uniref:M48 family metallopeptidase n=1 Tax=Aquicoccus sp. G2-2 TaxID=3092120 RepID=UPI002AE06740|nr:M48 family metallopeptidase [Aquicoccus sp. G2-2]MEA1112218.1 M48 family metallopeptidase [Aquicoccus sp. G2-2]